MIIAVACSTLTLVFFCFASDLVEVLFSGFVCCPEKEPKIRQSDIILLSSVTSKFLLTLTRVWSL